VSQLDPLSTRQWKPLLLLPLWKPLLLPLWKPLLLLPLFLLLRRMHEASGQR
jgi:hypothetical protein